MTEHREYPTQVKTKIIATVGPACEDREQLRRLAVAGADVFRVNLAHGTRESHAATIERVRWVSEQIDRPLAILADLEGPKIRLGEIPGGAMQCDEGDRLEFVADANPTGPHQLGTTYPQIVEDVVVGDRILLADGTVSLRVEAKSAGSVVCRVDQPGQVRSHQGVNLPGVHLDTPTLTDEDRAQVVWLGTQGVDFVGLSFVRSPSDVGDLRRALAEAGSSAQVVAKIERPEALDHLEAIVDAADAVMVARGDLGVEIDIARVPVVQKQIIEACNARRVPVITATQMLESMRLSSRPTRAESSDVAHAILDGCDALMLSGETAVGQYPVQAVEVMSRIARETEWLLRTTDPPPKRWTRPIGVSPVTEAVAYGAGRVAALLDAGLVVVATHSGQTALALSKQRNFVPTLGVSDNETTLRRMALYWGVTPLRADAASSGNELLDFVVTWGKRHDLLQRGDRVVLLTSTHWQASGHNLMLVHEVT